MQDVTSRPADHDRRSSVDLDREQIAALGLTVDQVEIALNSAYGSRQVSQIYAPDDQYQVIMRVAPQYQRDPAALSLLYVQDAGRQARAAVGVGDVASRRRAAIGEPRRTAAGGHDLVQPASRRRAGRRGRAACSSSARTLPATITGTFQGTAQAFQDSMQGLGWILALAIFVIYVVLGILYESFIHPLTILSGLPSAGFGALLTLLLFIRS